MGTWLGVGTGVGAGVGVGTSLLRLLVQTQCPLVAQAGPWACTRAQGRLLCMVLQRPVCMGSHRMAAVLEASWMCRRHQRLLWIVVVGTGMVVVLVVTMVGAMPGAMALMVVAAEEVGVVMVAAEVGVVVVVELGTVLMVALSPLAPPPPCPPSPHCSPSCYQGSPAPTPAPSPTTPQCWTTPSF